MQIYEIWILGLLEVIVALLATILYLVRRQNPRHHRDLSQDGKFDSISYDHTDFLQNEINKTKTRLVQVADDGVTSGDTVRALELRLSALQAEKNAWDRGCDDREAFWQGIVEELQRLFANYETVSDEHDDLKDEIIASQAERIENYEARLENLEAFKSLFFDLKGKLYESQELNQQFHDEITRTIPAEMQSPEMKEMLERLSQENTELEKQLQYVEQELQAIMSSAGELTTSIISSTEADDQRTRLNGMSDVSRHIETEMVQIKEIISNQKKKIRELNLNLDELQLEVNEKDYLHAEMKKLEGKNEEMAKILEVLEEENTFLQEQISVLLKQELDNNETTKFKLQEYEKLLLAKEKALNEIERKFGNMEQEYLTMYQENQQLKQRLA